MSVTLRKRALLLCLISLSTFAACASETDKSVSGNSPNTTQSSAPQTTVARPAAKPSRATALPPKRKAATLTVDPTPKLYEAGEIRGNKRSMIYHWPGCRNYDDIAEHNRVPFQTRAEAEQAGYRAARNCP